MTKLSEFTGWIIGKENLKVYKKNEFYGNINHKLTIIKEQDQQKLTVFVYSNLVSKKILRALQKNQYIDKIYHFFCQRKKQIMVLTDWQEITNHEQKT